MSIGLKADPGGASGSIQIAGVDKVIVTNAGDVAATTFTGNLIGNADTATKFAATTGTAPVFGVRAWVNFDSLRDTTGALSTANTNRLIRGSGNVSSVLRNSSGDYTITFTLPMPSANYTMNGTASSTSTFTNAVMAKGTSFSSGSVNIVTTNANTAYDFDIVSVIIVG